MEKNIPRKLITVFSIIIILLGFITNAGNFVIGAILLFMNLRKMKVKAFLGFFGWFYIIIETLALLVPSIGGERHFGIYTVANFVIGLVLLVLYYTISSKDKDLAK